MSFCLLREKCTHFLLLMQLLLVLFEVFFFKLLATIYCITPAIHPGAHVRIQNENKIYQTHIKITLGTQHYNGEHLMVLL